MPERPGYRDLISVRENVCNKQLKKRKKSCFLDFEKNTFKNVKKTYA